MDTYNPYDIGGDTTITIPTYPTPSTQHQFPALYQTPTTSSNTLQTTYELVRDGAGCEFSAPTTGAVMVEDKAPDQVQWWNGDVYTYSTWDDYPA